MLTFPKDFFLEETREDFYIESMMKRAWAAQLEVLSVIVQICNKYGLQYFADWGTLLGAVRHKGFIPWDDDIDICMLRKDYDKFLAVAEPDLPEEYQILSLHTNMEWHRLFTRNINAGSVSYDEKRLKKFHGCPYVVGVDIFPLDELPEDPQQEDLFTQFFNAVYFPAHLYDQAPSETEELIPDWETLCNIKIDPNKDIQNQLLKASEAVSKSYQNSGSPIITCMPFHSSHKRFLRKEWYSSCIYLPFEQFELPVPVDYEAVLTTLFGDYMTPVRYNSHNYPFYKTQQEIYDQTLRARLQSCVQSNEPCP